MLFSASASSTLDPDIPSASNSSVPLVHVNPAFDCRVCSSPLPASGGRSRERWGRGRGANWTAGVNYKDWSSVCHQLLLHARRRSSLTRHASLPSPSSQLPPHIIWPACCAWVDEVLRDSVEWWTFTQFCKCSFNTDASVAMSLAR